MKIFSRYVVFLAITVFVGSTAAANKVVVVPLIENSPTTPSTIFVKSHGIKVGVAGMAFDEDYDNNDVIFGLSFSGYKFGVYVASGELFNIPRGTVVYTDSGCGGISYTTTSGNRAIDENEGVVFPSPWSGDPNNSYFIPSGSSARSVSYLSYLDSAGCRNLESPTSAIAYPVSPNDSTVTGVSNSPFALPITTGF